jgi:hypothetical protein
MSFGSLNSNTFTNSENFKINKFNSKFHTPVTSGVDAFAFNWAGENNWLVPPLNLVNRGIKHCLACGTALSSLQVELLHFSHLSTFYEIYYYQAGKKMHHRHDHLHLSIQ